MKNPRRKKASSADYSGRRKKRLQPKRLRIWLCLRPRLKAPSRNCRHCLCQPRRLPEKIYRPCRRSPPKSRICRPSRTHRIWPRKWSAKISSANSNGLPMIERSACPMPILIYRPCRAQDQLRKNRPVYRPCPSPVAEFQNCLSCPSPAEPNPTCRLCPSRAVPPQCLLCRSRKVSRIFRLCPNQKPVVREISHPCRRFHQISNRRRLLDIRITPKNGVIWSFTPPHLELIQGMA